jgi:hypothetical protein
MDPGYLVVQFNKHPQTWELLPSVFTLRAFFYVSVISICAESYVSRAAKGQLEGSRIRYEQKMTKYLELGARFKPLVA